MNQIFGGQLLQAQTEGGESFLYLSANYTNGPITTTARGGVPVLFPQFNNLGSGRKHGFARNVAWEAKSDQHYQLCVPAHEYDQWPHSAQLDLNWEVKGDTLKLRMAVLNSGSSSFAWSGGLHPYWAVPDLLQCRLTGLAELVTWDGVGYEQLFDTSANLLLDCGVYSLALEMSGFRQWMVWNPGWDGAKAFPDMPPQDWRRFLCVEPVCASCPVSLKPGEVFVGTLAATWVNR